MRAAAALLLIACGLATAACGHAPQADAAMNEEMAAKVENRLMDPDKVMADRWKGMFANPARVVSAANEFDYQSGAYRQSGTGWRAVGKEQLLPKDADPAILVRTGFAATGAKADLIDTVSFTFDFVQKRKAKTQKEADSLRYPPRIVGGFLSRFEVGTGDEIRNALQGRTSASREKYGVAMRVNAQPIPGGKPDDRHLTVTFTRTGASAPVNSQTQGK
ncbi:hypothetical protein IAG41_12115 [Sphingomonas sp. JC676]|uniref:hypothetical protein n=1 Tax=Sphingomonas sp. JC676 TaxID=2768065 RepID=UPI001657DEDE|nr:hypothetical protein [Sphingomonas sp. JC676]MBC9033135.1 hypothetical protein [Sphingomonas sp. JC676]